MKIAGITGAKRAGKDTFYHVLKARGYDVAQASFAQPLKAHVDQLPGLSGGSKEQLRPLYQLYGELAKDLQGQSYWISLLERYLRALKLPDSTSLIITDVRFQFEANWIKEQGGEVVKVVRDGLSNDDTHVSELQWKSINETLLVTNTGSLSQYAEKVVSAWETIKSHEFMDTILSNDD